MACHVLDMKTTHALVLVIKTIIVIQYCRSAALEHASKPYHRLQVGQTIPKTETRQSVKISSSNIRYIWN